MSSPPDDDAVLPLLCRWPAGLHRVCGCAVSRDWPHCEQPCRDPARQGRIRQRRDQARIWLCRCGRSRGWPHCDGSHNRPMREGGPPSAAPPKPR